MKKLKLAMAAAAILSLTASPAVYADGFAPGEGMYLGAFVGHAAGHVSAKVEAIDRNSKSLAPNTTDTYEFKDGGLAVNGMEGGGWIGYGYKMGDLYVGFEGDFAGGGGKFKLTSDTPLTTRNSDVTVDDLSEVSAEMQWNGGAGGRIGYYVNEDTLFSIKVGISAAKLEVKYADETENFYAGGPRFGAAIESRISAIDPNLSVKLAGNYVDYMNAKISGIGNISSSRQDSTSNTVSGGAYNMRLGIQYSFFDVNSLF
jgi:opacity protein-like surface antigen